MTYVAHTLRPGDRRAADDRTYVMAHATGQGWWEEGPGTVSASDARHDNNLVYSLQDGAANQEKGQNGLGVGDDGVMYTLDAKGKHAVAFDWQSGGDVRLHVSEERTSPLQGKQTPAVAFTERTRREGRNFESQEELAYALMNPGSGGRTHSRQVLAFMENQRAEVRETEQAQTLSNGGGKPGQGYPAVRDGMAVRRLMPVECLRLQGFPDDYLDGVGLSDTEAYRLIGNSVTVPVFRWVAERLRKVLEESS